MAFHVADRAGSLQAHRGLSIRYWMDPDCYAQDIQHDSQICQLPTFLACWANGVAREDPAGITCSL